MARLSTTACSTRSSARNVLSSMPPERTLRSLVRTKAGPLPGFTCWKSTTWNSPSDRSRAMPVFRSWVVVAAMRARAPGACRGLDGGILGRQRQRAAALGGDHDRVLDADATVLGEVDAGLDGDDVAVGQVTSRGGRDPRRLVDVEAHAVPGAVQEGVLPPGVAQDRPARLVDLRCRDPRSHGGHAGRLRCPHR